MAYITNPARTFHIAVELEQGGTYFETVYDCRRKAIGRVFGGLREAGVPGKRIVFCKATEELTESERWEWGVETATDQARWQRQCDQNRLTSDMMDLY